MRKFDFMCGGLKPIWPGRQPRCRSERGSLRATKICPLSASFKPLRGCGRHCLSIFIQNVHPRWGILLSESGGEISAAYRGEIFAPALMSLLLQAFPTIFRSAPRHGKMFSTFQNGAPSLPSADTSSGSLDHVSNFRTWRAMTPMMVRTNGAYPIECETP